MQPAVFGLLGRLGHRIRGPPAGIHTSPAGAETLICAAGPAVPSSVGEGLGITSWKVCPAGLCSGGPGRDLDAAVPGCCSSLHPSGIRSGFPAINLVGHWMSMLPRPITSGKSVDLQEGGENAAVRISQVGCCFLRRSWLLNTVEPRTKGRNQSLLLFGSARAGFDPICRKTKPRFGMKSLGRMKSWMQKRIPFLEAQLRCWWLALHPFAWCSAGQGCVPWSWVPGSFEDVH